MRKASALSVGVLWLTLSIPLWMFDVALGGEFMASTAAAFVAGMIAGVLALRQLKMPARAWRTALIALFALQQFCRFTTPPREDVNFCVLMWFGWEGIFKSYLAFWACLAALSAAVFAAASAMARRLAPTSSA